MRQLTEVAAVAGYPLVLDRLKWDDLAGLQRSTVDLSQMGAG